MALQHSEVVKGFSKRHFVPTFVWLDARVRWNLHELLQLCVLLLLFSLQFVVVGHESLLLQQQTLV